jgi:hypothetical protein
LGLSDGLGRRLDEGMDRLRTAGDSMDDLKSWFLANEDKWEKIDF